MDKQTAATEELRERIGDIISMDDKFDDDFYLRQWLKTQKFMPDKTEVKIRQSLRWRQDMQIDANLDEDIITEVHKATGWKFGQADNGAPIIYLMARRLDFNGILKRYGVGPTVRYWSKLIAKCEEDLINWGKLRKKSSGKEMEPDENDVGITVLVNIRGFSIRQVASINVVKACNEFLSNMVHYFPAIFNPVILVNMSKTFQTVLTLFKAILSVSNIRFICYGCDEEDWKGKLLSLVEVEKLQDFLQ